MTSHALAADFDWLEDHALTAEDMCGAYPDDLLLIDLDDEFDLAAYLAPVPLLRGVAGIDDCIPF